MRRAAPPCTGACSACTPCSNGLRPAAAPRAACPACCRAPTPPLAPAGGGLAGAAPPPLPLTSAFHLAAPGELEAYWAHLQFVVTRHGAPRGRGPSPLARCFPFDRAAEVWRTPACGGLAGGPLGRAGGGKGPLEVPQASVGAVPSSAGGAISRRPDVPLFVLPPTAPAGAARARLRAPPGRLAGAHGPPARLPGGRGCAGHVLGALPRGGGPAGRAI